MKIDIKTLISLFAMVAALSGIWYTTQDRLHHLEEDVTQLQKQVNRLLRTR